MKTTGVAFDFEHGVEQTLMEDSYILKSEHHRMFIEIRGAEYEIPSQLTELSRKVEREELRVSHFPTSSLPVVELLFDP